MLYYSHSKTMGVIAEIVIDNFGTWIILFTLLLLLIGNRFRDKNVTKLFYAFLIGLSLLYIADILDYYFSIGNVLSPWRYVGSIFGYILRPALLMILLFILFRREKKNNLVWA